MESHSQGAKMYEHSKAPSLSNMIMTKPLLVKKVHAQYKIKRRLHEQHKSAAALQHTHMDRYKCHGTIRTKGTVYKQLGKDTDMYNEQIHIILLVK